MSKLGYRVDVIHQDGDVFASSDVVTGPPWSRVDDALAEAESLVSRMRECGIGAEARVSIIKIKIEGRGSPLPC